MNYVINDGSFYNDDDITMITTSQQHNNNNIYKLGFRKRKGPTVLLKMH